ncbi:hypothetical protein M9Y10_038740 [Tritrichomonas musculus]|uniref:HMG box domain-containing protein n=1 Tax=Tritrichomonas musculus TaxID=1915356 RepID=A0ABR2KB40_9EUKA
MSETKPSDLWDSILLKFIQEKVQNSPSTPISDAYSEAYQTFLDQKWICYLEPNKYNFTEEEYQKLGFDDGPDLTRIPRSRYLYIKGIPSKKSLAQAAPARKKTRYNNFTAERFKIYKGEDFKEISKKISLEWKELTEEEKQKYDY